ncbi:MAG: DUF2798 domain-containing protein [Rhodospirillales bacterium]|nr:DUF2798 domain-containing protein [Rhodospirillales bacterium]
MLPARYEPVAFGFVLSGMMSLLVSGISTARAAPQFTDFPANWGMAWLMSWAIAFPVVLVVAPVARRIVRRLFVA